MFDDGARGVGPVASVNVVTEIEAELGAVVRALFVVGVDGAASDARHLGLAVARLRAHAVHVADGWFIHTGSNKVSASNIININYIIIIYQL